MKKFIASLLILASTVYAANPTPQKFPNDTLIIGNATSGVDKVFEMYIGGSDPKMTYSISSGGFKFNKNFLQFGSGLSADQTFAFDIGSGSTNPKLKWDSASSSLQFSNDGSTYKKLGSGGGGGGGVNLLTTDDNSDFENGTTSWTASGGSFTIESVSPIYGLKSAKFLASGSGQTLSSVAKTVQVGLQGQSCLAAIAYEYTGTSGDYSLQVFDGTNILGTQSLVASTTPSNAFVGFNCPASGTVLARIISNVASPGTITFDGATQSAGQVQLGSNILLANVSGTSFVGEVQYAGNASCTWTQSAASNTFSGFPAQASCNVASVRGNALAPATKIPAIQLPNLPKGEYLFVVQASFSPSATAEIRLFDGTTASPTVGITNGSFGGGPMSFAVNFPTSGTRTVQVQASGVGAGSNIDIDANIAGVQQFTIDVYKIDSSVTQLGGIDQTAQSGTWTLNNCSASPAAVSTSFVDFNSPSGCTFSQLKGNMTGVTMGSNAGSISFIPTGAGHTYRVCAVGTIDASNQDAYIRIVDQNSIAQQQQFVNSGAGGFHLCADIVTTGVTATVVKVQGGSPGFGTANLQGPGIPAAPNNPFIEWSILDISSQFPMPYLVKQLQSTSSSVMQHASAYIAYDGAVTYSVSRQDGNWIQSLTRVGAGNVQVNFVGGTFSSAPICTVNTGGPSNYSGNTQNSFATITSSLAQTGISRADTTTSTDSAFYIMCTGPK